MFKLNRRAFIKSTAGAVGALTVPTIVPATVFGGKGRVAPNDKIVLGMIGVGGMGSGHLRAFLGYDDVRVAAVCDVKRDQRLKAKAKVDEKYGDQNCDYYNDFRELLARKDIDAVCMATPDHWHVLIGIEASKQRKAIYYEKPLSRSFQENLAIRDAVNRYGNVFQFGTQQRSNERFRFACELVRNGKLGEMESIMIGSASFDPVPNQPTEPVPEGFDYDMWLGPAPWKPYNPLRVTRNWTLIYDYSLGCLSGAWGIHHVDIAQWAFDMDHTGPVETEGWGEFPKEGLYDTVLHWEIEHRYANGAKIIHMDMPTAIKRADPFKLHWMGILFKGSEGWIYVARDFMDASPKSLLKETIGSNDIQLPRSKSHKRNFLDAVRTGQSTICPIEQAVRSDTVCHLADIAMKLHRKVVWDPEKEMIVGDPEAEKMLKRPMRSPWHL